MATCEWCWGRAYMREIGDTSKSQADHYRDILAEQDKKGENADCPTMRDEAKLRALGRNNTGLSQR